MHADLGARLEAIVGPQVLSGAHTAPFAVDGLTPELVVRPGTQEEVAQVVAACSAAGAAMLPWGGGTAMGLGNAPARAEVVIQLDRLDRVVEWDPANLCVTAEAGMRLEHLQDVLARDHATLPLDPPAGHRTTLGGLVAANLSGPGRLQYGTVRDWLLGLRVVLPDGQRIRCGGRVIKNVSGLDMNKLYIRSLGSLGIITEATFKLLPLPAQRAGVAGLFHDPRQAWAVVEQIKASFLLPETVDFLDPEAAGQLFAALGLKGETGSCALAVALAGSAETVRRQGRDLAALIGAGGGRAVPFPASSTSLALDTIRSLMAGAEAHPRRVVCKLTVPIGQTSDLAGAAGELGSSCGFQTTVVAHACSGVVWACYRPGPDALPDSGLALALEGLRRTAVALEGSLVLQDAPTALKRTVDAWGAPPEGFEMMRRLKAEFDPRGVCNPGRFVGGI
jgi:glycolate oxidase FAD binding subunit